MARMSEANWIKDESEIAAIQAEPLSRSISDDDLCADCHWLAYCPGQNSLCMRHDGSTWPGTTDADGYVVACNIHKEIGS